MGRSLFAFRLDQCKFGNELVESLSRVLESPREEVAKLLTGCQYSISDTSSEDIHDHWYILAELQTGNDCMTIQPSGEPGWTAMLKFCCDYATNNHTPVITFDEGYSYCVIVNEGNTVEEINKRIIEDSFCGEAAVKELESER